ncbi:MAG: PAS domain S-box protein [Candidatus Woesebacteria bacterium]|nr:PAS domain S-box protein [Candidatus Woesebacteria bacterium]
MKVSTKILIGFLAIIFLVCFQLVVTQKLQNEILDSTRQIKDVEAPLEILAGKGEGFDTAKTLVVYAVLLNAQKGDYENIKTIKTNYYDLAVNTIISNYGNHQIENLVNQSERNKEQKVKTLELFHKLGETRDKVTALETQAFKAIDKKDLDTAYSLITGEEYARYKTEMQQSTIDWQALEKEISLTTRNAILKDSQQIIIFNLVCSLVGILFLLIVIFMLHSFIAEKEKGIIKKEKELSIREKMEQKYRILFENATDAIFIADVETRRLVDCNQSAENLMGYSRDELLSMNADELHPKDKIKETMEGFKKQAEGKIKSVFTEVLTKNNKRIPVKINASAVLIGNKRFNQGMFITTKPRS